ncbi:MAG: hypothetical protein ACOCRX_07555 [Candidatus Woesearchaeota archaeon]
MEEKLECPNCNSKNYGHGYKRVDKKFKRIDLHQIDNKGRISSYPLIGYVCPNCGVFFVDN